MAEAKQPPNHRRRSTRRTLALGSLALALLGLALLAYDVLTQVERATGWLPLLAGTVGLIAAALWSAVEDAAGAAPTVVDAPSDASQRGGEGPFRAGEVRGASSDPAARRWLPWITAGAVIAIVVQALVPLRYYLGDDEYDERFAWRMFSAVRMHECELSANETIDGSARPVRLMQTVHAGWVTTLRRNREAVMARYLRWRCTKEGVERARLDNRCVTPEGRPVAPIVREIDCASGEIASEGGEP